MKKAIVILLEMILCHCSASCDELSDKYLGIALDCFSINRKSDLQVDKIKELAEGTTDPYDKATLEDLIFLHVDSLYTANDYAFLSFFVSGPIWHVWPHRDSIKSAIEQIKPILDIDLICEMAFSARDMDNSNGLFSHMEFEEVLMQKINALSKRMRLRKDHLEKRNESSITDRKAVEYMRSNLYTFRCIFRAAERESAMVISLNPSYKMRQFIWVVNLLGGNIKGLASADYMVSWTEFNEIEDWFWINEHRINSGMIGKALKLYSKLCLPLFEFNTQKYKELISEDLYNDIITQTAEAGITPLRDCQLNSK